MEEKVRCLLSGNQLKMIALIAMTLDHMGKQLFPYMGWMQIVGRLAFPIFAFMIAEGCAYTQNRKKYFGGMALLALVCQVVYFVAEKSLYQSVLVSFSLAILLIYAIDYARENPNMKGVWVAVLALGLICFACIGLPALFSGTDYSIDYGIVGILLVAGVYFAKGKLQKLIVATVLLMLLAVQMGGIQWFGLLSIPILALYSGKRGKRSFKYLFYVYYPLHLVVIYLLSFVL